MVHVGVSGAILTRGISSCPSSVMRGPERGWGWGPRVLFVTRISVYLPIGGSRFTRRDRRLSGFLFRIKPCVPTFSGDYSLFLKGVLTYVSCSVLITPGTQNVV